MRVIIAGLGAVGTMAAWHLTRKGVDVIGLEQYAAGHKNGSSHGESRIVRSVYPDPLYTSLMVHAFRYWDEFLEADHNACDISARPAGALLNRCGGIYLGTEGSSQLIDAAEALSAAGAPFMRFSNTELRQHFPAFNVAESEAAIYDPGMGYARPAHVVDLASRLSVKAGADLRYNSPIRAWNETHAGVEVTLENGETLGADHLLLTGGAWIPTMLADAGIELPLTVTRQVFAHFQPSSSNRMESYAPGKFPVWIDANSNMYGFPMICPETGIKIACHNPGEVTDPDHTDRQVAGKDIEPMLQCIQGRFPGILTEPCEFGVCLYTSTPTEDFIMDTVPGSASVHLFSACSGHGFKFAPLTGALAASMVLGNADPSGIIIPDRFRLSAHLSATVS